MDIFLKAVACALIAVVLCLVLAKQGKDISLVITIAVCCMIITAAISYLNPVIAFVDRLQTLGQLNSGMLEVLLKAVGIGLLTEISALACSDAGNASLGKALQLLASAVILWIAIPLLNELIELIKRILEAV